MLRICIHLTCSIPRDLRLPRDFLETTTPYMDTSDRLEYSRVGGIFKSDCHATEIPT
jgi:hypothetical protein